MESRRFSRIVLICFFFYIFIFLLHWPALIVGSSGFRVGEVGSVSGGISYSAGSMKRERYEVKGHIESASDLVDLEILRLWYFERSERSN